MKSFVPILLIFWLLLWGFFYMSIWKDASRNNIQIASWSSNSEKGQTTTTEELLQDIFKTSRPEQANSFVNTWTTTPTTVVAKLPYSVTEPYYGSGFILSGNTIYSNDTNIAVGDTGEIYINSEIPSNVTNWKEIIAPEGWWLEKDTIMRRFYYYSVGVDEALLRKGDEKLQLRYKVMHNLLHNTNESDPMVAQWKECLTDLTKGFTYTNVPKDSIFKFCVAPVPENKNFTSEKDLTFVRYAFALAYKASQTNDIRVCDALGHITFDSVTYSSQFSIGEYYFICRALAEWWWKKILDYVYGFILTTWVSDRCELYEKEPTMQNICETTSLTLK